jgi:hypothetical protein
VFPLENRWGKAACPRIARPEGYQAAVRKAQLAKRVTSHMFHQSFATHLLSAGYDIGTVQEVLRHKDIRTTMIYMHVLVRGGRGVGSPADGLAGLPDECSAGAVNHSGRGVTTKQPTAKIRLTRINCLGVRPQVYGLRVIGSNFL